MSSFPDLIQNKMAEGTPYAMMPKYSPQLLAYSDVSKRVCTCQLCGLPIPKKSKRAVFAFRTRRRMFRGGGSSGMDKLFMHPACIVPLLNGKGKAPKHQALCWDCGEGFSLALTIKCFGSGGRIARLCMECGKKPEYASCERCSIKTSKRSLSVVVAPDLFLGEDFLGKSICDGCADCTGLVTAKIRNKEKRREDRFQDMYERLAEKLRSGRGFE